MERRQEKRTSQFPLTWKTFERAKDFYRMVGMIIVASYADGYPPEDARL